MIISNIGSLLLAFSSPLAQHGVAVNHAGMGARALSSLGNGVPLRIMPLGASITWGQQSTDGNGYRDALRSQLTGGGNLVNMVGSRKGGNMKDNDVEGWPGYRIDQVHEKAISAVPKWKPNVILVNAGTNDAIQKYNLTTVGARFEDFLLDLYRMSPRASILVSTLILNKNAGTEAAAVRINTEIRAVSQKLRNAGRKLFLVEMHGEDGPRAADMADDTHPNDLGYRKMANLWYAGMIQLSDLRWLEKAEDVAGVPDDGGA
ncbi:SGNH hydrolase-type esterase domain-containing protein [Cercophora scortea]|uniref:SGNH hydrolase-type esterase domain-containing protein n=1 Tax=Cercophora scortea TaxID=314031 RepID=A0AAE0IF51_9PEZI|nr:SGNH hydrolase-type esterase domain-containing protein [Cercophora scortea]